MSSPLFTEGCLADVLLRCLQYKIHTVGCETVSIGRFRFDVHDHSTGVDVRGCIVNDDGDRYEFINGTYWKYWSYTFNTFKHESGAWDAELTRAYATLKNECDEERQKQVCAQLAYDEARQAAHAERKKKFESLFPQPGPIGCDEEVTA